jgi:hypothetical protein
MVLLPGSLLAIHFVMHFHRSNAKNLSNSHISLPFLGTLTAILAPNFAYYVAHVFQSTIDPLEWTGLKEISTKNNFSVFVNLWSTKLPIVIATIM